VTTRRPPPECDFVDLVRAELEMARALDDAADTDPDRTPFRVRVEEWRGTTIIRRRGLPR
jgi:hypothetical protein